MRQDMDKIMKELMLCQEFVVTSNQNIAKFCSDKNVDNRMIQHWEGQRWGQLCQIIKKNFSLLLWLFYKNNIMDVVFFECSNLPKKENWKRNSMVLLIELYTCQKICICYYWTPLRSCAYNIARFVNDE